MVRQWNRIRVSTEHQGYGGDRRQKTGDHGDRSRRQGDSGDTDRA